MTKLDFFLIFLFVLLFLFITIHQLILIYNRYLRNYKKEIETFLNSDKYELVDTRNPNDKDWIKSPFQKPPKFGFSLLIVTMNGSIVTWTKTDYLVIIAQRDNKLREFWIQIKTSYFRKPNLVFKIGQTIKDVDLKINKDIKIVTIKDKCPACGFKISELNDFCPDCGLNFK
jgi:hypothetical protein